jgi:hypothetical protein
LSLEEIAQLSKMPEKALQEVYNKGLGAYHNNYMSVRPKVRSPEQWAMARVYSFVMKRKGTFGHVDRHIAEKYNLVGGRISDILKPHRIINEFVNPKSLLRSRISDVFKGIRNNLPPSARRLLEVEGDHYITSLIIRREPVQSALHTALDYITLGQWNTERLNANYDKIFHLGLILILDNGKQILIEKNEVIYIYYLKPSNDSVEFLPLPPLQTPTTLNQFIANAVSVKGNDFYKYDPFANNCQDFVAILLQANNIYPPSAESFVKQPVDSLLSKLPSWTQPVLKGITDLGAVANVALEGAGHSIFLKQLNELGINPESYLKKARLRAKAHGYDSQSLNFADDNVHKLAILNDGKTTMFGRVNYGDYIIYQFLEASKKAEKGIARSKQNRFRKSHMMLPGDWKSNKFSPNNLALNILW